MQHLHITQDNQLVDSTNRTIDASQRTRYQGESEVIVWVPTEQVTLLEVTIPTRNPNELEQSLPYAVEEELLEDVAQLHFAWKATPKNTPIPVAVVRKACMHCWLEMIKPLKLASVQMLPDVFALPWDKDTDPTPSMWITKDRTVIRTAAFSGFAGDSAVVAEYIRINQLNPVSCQPFITLTNTRAKGQVLPTALLENSGLRLDQIQAHSEYINLLQGEFQAGGASFIRVLRKNRAITIGSLALATLLLTYQLVQYLLLRQEIAYLETQIVKRTEQIIPGYQINQPLQPLVVGYIENQRAALKARQALPFAILEKATSLLGNCNNCVFESLEVDQNGIHARIGSYTPLDGLNAQLQTLGGYQITSNLSTNNDYHRLHFSIATAQQNTQQ